MKLMQDAKYYKWIILVSLLLMSARSYAVDPWLIWKTHETENFYIHFADGYESYASRVASIAEEAHASLIHQLQWSPKEKTHLVISDESDSANGFASPLHFNRSVLYVAPPDDATGLEDYSDWLRTLIVHEYVHVLHLDRNEGAAAAMQNLFGRMFLLFPNLYQPLWMIEGLATYMETDEVSGRGQSTLYQMMMREEVVNGIKPVSQVNLPLHSWPMGSTPYLYGVYFFQFLQSEYGDQAAQSLLTNYSDNLIPFMINTNTQAVLGVDVEELWREFDVYLKQRFSQDTVVDPVEGIKLTQYGYFVDSADMASDGSIYYVVQTENTHTQIRQWKGDTSTRIRDVHPGARLDVNNRKEILLSQLEYCNEYTRYRDLYIAAPDKTLKRISECGRYRSAAWGRDGNTIYAVQLEKGASQLVKLDTVSNSSEVIWRGEQNVTLGMLRASPVRDELVVSIFRPTTGWNIEVFDITNARWYPLTLDSHVDIHPSFSRDGENILFSSDRSGRYQIYRAERQGKRLQQLTRVRTGAFWPVQSSLDSALYYTGYHGGGRDLYRINNPQVVAGYDVIPDDIEHSTDTTYADVTATPYRASSSMRPRWWLPFLILTEDENTFGFMTSGNDALGIHQYQLDLGYDVEQQSVQGRFSYAFANRLSLGFRRGIDILKDSQNQFAAAAFEDDLFAVIAFNRPAVEKRLNFYAGIIQSHLHEARREPGIAPLNDFDDNIFGLALTFDNSHRYIQSMSRSDGIDLRLIAESSDVIDSDYTGEVYTLDARFMMSPMKAHVIALRLLQGWGTDRPEPFRLGGEDNDYNALDVINPISDPLFSNRRYALRGYAEGLAELRGRRMQKASLEWRLPGQLVERGWMAPPIGMMQWSASFFTETGSAYFDNADRRYYSSAGAELEADVNLFYGLTTRMRFGYAKGLDEQLGEDRWYFNLGASF